MAETYYAGTQGRVLAGKTSGATPEFVDWNVTSWDASVKANSATTTTTGCYDEATKRTWTRRIATTHEASGTYEFLYDKDNPPFAIMTPGQTVEAEFYINDTDKLTGSIYIDSNDLKSGGMEGVGGCSVKWTSNGTIVLPSEVVTP